MLGSEISSDKCEAGMNWVSISFHGRDLTKTLDLNSGEAVKQGDKQNI